MKVFVWNIHIINPFAGAVCGELTGEFQKCHIEEVATGFDQFEVTSDQDRKALGDFAVEMFKVVKGFDQNIGYVKALSEKSSWRQEVYTKLV